MERNNLRKVKLSKNENGTGGFGINGYFHAWGNRAYLPDNGSDFPILIGIVELESGTVTIAEPRQIKFVNEF